jgi:TPR repeat protein
MTKPVETDKAAMRLMSAGRILLGRGDTKFSIAKLCAEARVAEDEFDRVFESRAALFKALMKPPAMEAALVKRLAEFEKNLATLGARFEKAEREHADAIARLEEKLGGPVSQHSVGWRSGLPQDYFGPVRRAARQYASMARLPSRRTTIAAIAALAIAMTAGIPLLQAARGNGPARDAADDSIAVLQARAEDGDAKAQSALAFAYLGSPGTARDVSAAAHWAQTAAEQGDANAQYLIGSLSLAGTGVSRDPKQAVSWFTRSAAAGNVKAMHNLAIAYVQGNGAPKNPAAAATWFARAASQGYVDSAFDLAVLYEQGLGVEQNPREALRWYRVAANAGDRSAAARAHVLETDGRP